MSPIADSLIPVFLLLMTGWTLRKSNLIASEQWIGIERLAYYVLFPTVIVDTLIRANLNGAPVAAVGGALFLSVLAMAGLLLVLRPNLEARGIDGPAFTSLFQGATRWNTFVALAISASLFGQQGLTIMAIAIAAMIPLLNILAILVLTRYGGARHHLSVWQYGKMFVGNPLIWSCAIGISLNVTGWPVPKALASYTQLLGQGALASGLLLTGAGLDLKRLVRPEWKHALAVILKLAVMPIFAINLGLAFGVQGMALSVLGLAASVPTAGASYVMARQFKGDAKFMAEILTLQTLTAFVTLPLILRFLSN